jgi:hypothetical protein
MRKTPKAIKWAEKTVRTRSRNSPVKVLLSSLCILLTIPGIHGQNRELFTNVSGFSGSPLGTAILSGTVVDENDAVVPAATVLVRDISKTIKKDTRTSAVGIFVVTQLPAGNYTVAVQQQGFATAEIKGLSLKVNDQLSLKIQLKVGQIGETVTIDPDSSIVQRSAAVETTLNRQMIENLPLNGRSLQPVISLTPGVTVTRPTFGEQGQFGVNGQRASANYFVVDGVSANIGVAAGADGLGQSGSGSLPGLSALGTTHSIFTVDGLQQFKILTSTYAPEFGRVPGAQVQVQTRSGTNQFRGSLFEYFRSGVLSANDWFANRDGLPKPDLNHHDFGGVVGGPIIKGKTFFFASYEGLRLRLPQVATVDVPSMSSRATAPEQVRPFLNAFPHPNGEETVNGLARFSASYTDQASLHATTIRIDQKLGEKLSLFGRYSHGISETETRGGASSSLNTTLQMAFQTQTLTIGLTQLITPNISNDFRANYSGTRGGKYFQVDDFGGAEPFDESLVFPTQSSVENSLYAFSLGSNTSFLVGKDATNHQHQLNFVDSLTILSGSHQIKLGVDYRRLMPVYGEWKYKQFASFNTIGEALSGTASSVAIQTQDKVGLLFTNFSAYGQDVWKLSRRFTLTYGMRWEFNPPPKGTDDQVLYTVQGLDNPQALTLAPAGTPYYRKTYNNFAPRFGVAYQFSEHQGWERVLRGGFGIFYDLGTGSLANGAVSFPYLRRRVLSNVSFPLNPASAEAPSQSLNPPVGRIHAANPHLQLPLTMQWNVTFEQSLGSKRSLSASYVGASGRRLLRLEMLVNPNPDFGQVFITTNEASSSYHALQLQFQRRLSRSLQSHLAYTWSHSIDNASNDSFPNPPSAVFDPRLDRASSDFDVRHSFAGAITYNIPTPPFGAFGKLLLRDWSVDGIITARTAAPVDIFFRRDLGFGPFNFRPDVVPRVPPYRTDPSLPGGREINRAAFVVPQTPTQGSVGRNALRGFPLRQMDLALRRRFAFAERLNLQFRMDIFNVFNRPNFADPIGDLSNSFFGTSTAMFGRSLGSNVGSVGLNSIYQVGGPRTMQMSLKLQF